MTSVFPTGIARQNGCGLVVRFAEVVVEVGTQIQTGFVGTQNLALVLFVGLTGIVMDKGSVVCQTSVPMTDGPLIVHVHPKMTANISNIVVGHPVITDMEKSFVLQLAWDSIVVKHRNVVVMMYAVVQTCVWSVQIQAVATMTSVVAQNIVARKNREKVYVVGVV